VGKINASKFLLVACATALMVEATGFFLIGGKDSNQTRAGNGVTTETAADAGAQVTPTEPKLRIEPK
jgi:hypothetical protein